MRHGRSMCPPQPTPQLPRLDNTTALPPAVVTPIVGDRVAPATATAAPATATTAPATTVRARRRPCARTTAETRATAAAHTPGASPCLPSWGAGRVRCSCCSCLGGRPSAGSSSGSNGGGRSCRCRRGSCCSCRPLSRRPRRAEVPLCCRRGEGAAVSIEGGAWTGHAASYAHGIPS